MVERPILFNAPMVNATHANIKTQTRRPIEYMFDLLINGIPHEEDFAGNARAVKCPYGEVGEQLWVRENYRLHRKFDTSKASEIEPKEASPIFYEADGYLKSEYAGKLRPSIFMTRWASRTNLLITALRAERIQDITASDALAEGIIKIYSGVTGADIYAHYGAIKIDPVTQKKYVDPKFADKSAKGAFEKLWVAIEGQASWDANPWVWVITYQRLKNTIPNPLIQGE